MTNQESLLKIYNLGKRLFPENELSKYLEQIKNYDFDEIAFFTCISQENESVQLESSFLTTNLIFDFTLTKTRTHISVVPLKEVTSVQNSIVENQKMVLNIYSNSFFLKYKTYNDHDNIILNNYSIAITKQLKEK